MSFKFYDYLKVPKTASDTEIKKAYKRLAVELHPDKGGDTNEFKKIAEAYETLSDPEKRQMYDRFGDGYQDNIGQGMQGGMPNFFGNVFTTMFKNMGKQKNEHITIELTLEEVYNGITKTLDLNLKKQCKNCLKSCNVCFGKGTQEMRISLGPFIQIVQQPCQTCNGTGFSKNSKDCGFCKGTSIINEQCTINITIPPGITEKHNIIKEGLGEQAKTPNEKPGDLVIGFKYKSHSKFKIRNDDLIYNVNISFLDSIIGTILDIPHFAGNIRIDTSDYGILQTKEYIIRNKGLPKLNTSEHGDLILNVKVNCPYKRLSDVEKQSIKECFSKIWNN